MTTSGTTTAHIPIPGSGDIWHIRTAIDNNLWVVDDLSNKLWRVTPAGVVTGFTPPTATSDPYGLTLGPDNNLWYAGLGNVIGRFVVPLPLPDPLPPREANGSTGGISAPLPTPPRPIGPSQNGVPNLLPSRRS